MTPDKTMAELQRRRRNRTIIGVAAIASITAVAAVTVEPIASLAWAGIALAIWLYQGAFVARRLEANHRPGETTLLPEFGIGTETTFVRGWLLACLAGFLIIPGLTGPLAWVPALSYMLGGVADYLDGYLARMTDHPTSLGEALDIELDALGLLIAVAIAIRTSALPVWYLPVGLARYAFIFGIWSRRRAGKSIHPLPPSESRRPLAGLQMGALTVILIPVLHPPVTTLGGTLLALPLLLGFIRDWLVVSGAIDPTSTIYQRTRETLKRIVLRWLPVPLRAAVIASVLRLGSVATITGGAGTGGSMSGDLPLPNGFVVPARLVEVAAAAAVGLGLAPRFSAAILLAVLLLRAGAGATSTVLLAALTATVGILMVGGGAMSVWQPEVSLFRRRAGEKESVE